MSKLFDRPAIVKNALDEAIAECIAIDKTIVATDRNNLASFLALGKALWKIKDQCEHGQWSKALEKTGIPQQRASEAMRGCKLPAPVISKCSSIRDLVLSIPKTEDKKTEEAAPTIFCRPCRVGGAKANCKACKKLREQMADAEEESDEEDETDDEQEEAKEEEKPPEPLKDKVGYVVPDRLLPVFQLTDKWDKARKTAASTAKLIREIEDSEAYKRIERSYGEQPKSPKGRRDSSFFKLAALRLSRELPHSVCTACQGVEASPDQEDCSKCKGKGFLCKDEIK